MKTAKVINTMDQQSKIGRWNSRYETHKKVTPNRAKLLFGCTNYGLRVNTWPSLDKSPLRGLVNYDFRFTGAALQNVESAAV